MAGGSPMSAGEGRRWRRRATRAPACPPAPVGGQIVTGGGPWLPGHVSRWLGGGRAGGVGLRATGGLIGDKGGAQGQRWPSPQAWALAARSSSVGGSLATRATGRGGGCMVAVEVLVGMAIP
jgi:hypothetical protein